jgi:hypothetical protein
MKKIFQFLVFAALAQSAAATNLIVNGDFSSGAPSCAAGTQVLRGWSVTNNIDIDSGATGCGEWNLPAGLTHLVDLTGSFSDNVGTISQSVATQNETQYELSFYFGGNGEWQYLGYVNDGAIKSMNVLLNGNLLQNFSVDTTGQTWGDGGWRLERLLFTATSITTLSFQSLNGIASPSVFGPLLTGVNLEAVPPSPVPLPPALGLLGLGAIALRSLQRSGKPS